MTTLHNDPGSFPPSSVFGGPYRVPEVLPTGEWNVMANGRIFLLTVQGVSGTQVKATLNSGDLEDVQWNASEQLLTFTRTVPDQVEQAWSGYVMQYSKPDPMWRIGGTLRNVRSLGAHRVPLATGGWYATRPR